MKKAAEGPKAEGANPSGGPMEPDDVLQPCKQCGKMVLAECGELCLACELHPCSQLKIRWFGEDEDE